MLRRSHVGGKAAVTFFKGYEGSQEYGVLTADNNQRAIPSLQWTTIKFNVGIIKSSSLEALRLEHTVV